MEFLHQAQVFWSVSLNEAPLISQETTGAENRVTGSLEGVVDGIKARGLGDVVGRGHNISKTHGRGTFSTCTAARKSL